MGHAVAQVCGEALGPAVTRTDNTHYAIAWRTVPEHVVVGQHFVVDFAVCPKAGAKVPQAVRVDANMPAHRHGMNYRTGVAARGAGTYRAEGLLFHMAGRWELTFDVVSGNTTERLTSPMQLP
jgi:hypothetical protein